MIPDHYKIQRGIQCCANCRFGGYLGDIKEKERLCICELLGQCKDENYGKIAVEPLGICDAWKSN